MKKWIVAALALAILILYINSYLTYFISRVRTISVDEYTWDYAIDDGRVTIVQVSPRPSGAVSIPSELGGKPVTSIGNYAFLDCKSLTSVTIPNSVTSIGKSAFYYCESLKSVMIPDSVKSIGADAFFGCSALTSITISDSVTSIGESAFRGCESLTSVTIPDSVTRIGDGAFLKSGLSPCFGG